MGLFFLLRGLNILEKWRYSLSPIIMEVQYNLVVEESSRGGTNFPPSCLFFRKIVGKMSFLLYSWDMLVSVRLLTDLNREFLELWMTRTRHRQSPLVEVIKADQVRCSVLQAGPQKQIVFNGVL